MSSQGTYEFKIIKQSSFQEGVTLSHLILTILGPIVTTMSLLIGATSKKDTRTTSTSKEAQTTK